MTPSLDPTQSPAHTTKSYNSPINTNCLNRPVPLAGEAVEITPSSVTPLSTEKSADTQEDRKPNPIPGMKYASGKMIANSAGKKNYFNCRGEDHWFVNCSELTAAQCEELAGMAHISIGEDILDGIGFL
jgi:hypothetical protein